MFFPALDFNGMTEVGRIAVVAGALLTAFMLVKILAGLLRIVVVVVFIACLGVMVLQPSFLNEEISKQIVKIPSSLSAK